MSINNTTLTKENKVTLTEEEHSKIVGEKIKKRRIKKDIPKTRLSSKCKISRKKISNIEKGITPITLYEFEMISQELEMSFEDVSMTKENENIRYIPEGKTELVDYICDNYFSKEFCSYLLKTLKTLREGIKK